MFPVLFVNIKLAIVFDYNFACFIPFSIYPVMYIFSCQQQQNQSLCLCFPHLRVSLLEFSLHWSAFNSIKSWLLNKINPIIISAILFLWNHNCDSLFESNQVVFSIWRFISLSVMLLTELQNCTSSTESEITQNYGETAQLISTQALRHRNWTVCYLKWSKKCSQNVRMKENSDLKVSKPMTGVNYSIRNVEITDIQTENGVQTKTCPSENEVSTFSTHTLANSYKLRKSDTGES